MKHILLFLLLLFSISLQAQDWFEAQKLTDSVRWLGGRFGHGIDVSGDFAIIGAYYDDAAYIYKKNSTDQWEETQTLIPPIYTGSNDFFGYAVAIDGDYAIVGQPRYDSTGFGLANYGRAFMFKRQNNGIWEFIKQMKASDGEEEDFFGSHITISGEYAAIGVPQKDGGYLNQNQNQNAGAVYIFKKNEGGPDNWGEIKKLVPTTNNGTSLSNTDFGSDVSILNNEIIVGASGYYSFSSNGTPLPNSGSVFIFDKNEGGIENWGQTQILLVADRGASDRLGASIHAAGNHLIVGASSKGSGIYEAAGVAYIFEKVNGSWVEKQKIYSDDRESYDYFGHSVSISEDYAIVGAYYEDENSMGLDSMSSAGSAYIFKKNPNGVWSQEKKIVPSDRGSGDHFGTSVYLEDEFIFLGSPQDEYDFPGQSFNADAGAVYVFKYGQCPTVDIEITGDTILCQGESVILSTLTGPDKVYQWQLNGADILEDTTEQIIVSLEGDYSIVVTEDGCSVTSAAVSVAVKDLPMATVIYNGNTTFCQGGELLLKANIGINLSHQWQVDGVDISGATGPNYSVNESGFYTVVVTEDGCSTISDAVVVQVTAAPPVTVMADGPTAFCMGGSVVLSVPGAGASYQWQVDGVDILGAISNSYSATTSGSYTVTASENGCASTSTATIVTVTNATSAQITVSGSTTICAGENVELQAPTGTGLSYQWQLDGIDISGAISETYSAELSGDYTVIVTGNGCSVTSTAETVTVNTVPTASISTSGMTTFCQGENVELQALMGTGFSYQWQLDGIDIGSATTETYIANETGAYSVVVTDANCSSTSLATNIISYPNPDVVPTTQNASCNMLDGSVTLIVNGLVGTPVYTWSDGSDGMVLQNVGAGDYTVTVTDQSTGCSATTTATVQATDTPISLVSVTETNCDQATGMISLDLSNTIGTPTFLWNTGSTDQNLSGLSQGDYEVTITNGNGCTLVSNASIEETASPDAMAIGNSIDCMGGAVTLQGSSTSTVANYVWTGPNGFTSTEQAPIVSSAGQYTLLITDSSTGCTATAEASVTLLGDVPTGVTIIETSPLCSDSDDGVIVVTSVTGGTSPYLYALDTGVLSSDSIFSNLSGGEYSVEVQDANGCSIYETVELIQPMPIVLDLGGNISTTANTQIKIPAPSGYSIYAWDNNTSEPELIITAQGTTSYSLTVSDDNGCTAVGSVTVSVSGSAPNTDIDVFTPNGDGKNDNFVVSELKEDPTAFPGNEFIVFNRWGNEVFYQKDYDNTWEGTNKKGELLPQGTYFYLILLDKTRSAFLRRGEVLLLR